MQLMGWEPGVYKGVWSDMPEEEEIEAAGWKRGAVLRRICPNYGSDPYTIPEMSKFLWDIGYVLSVRYVGPWIYASVHRFAHVNDDQLRVNENPDFEAVSLMDEMCAAVCHVFKEGVISQRGRIEKVRAINRKKQAKRRAKKTKDQE
jgi:hypothetical protein